MPIYRRVLLKLSGEVFGGGQIGVDPDVVQRIARQIAEVVRLGTQVAVVVGGGNFFRGAELSQRGMDRVRADYMGMLGTVMNYLGTAGFPGEAGHPDARADCDHHGPGCRALHPAARRATPGEGSRRDLRRGGGHAVLLHRHRQRAQRALEIGCRSC